MYLLDTNIVSELRKAAKQKADPNVMKWFQKVRLSDCYLSAITITELRIGILSKQKKDPLQFQSLNDWFENSLLKAFSGRVLPLDFNAAFLCAELHIPDRSPINDAYIAAIAKSNGLTLVTRNTKDFSHTNLSLLNPFEIKD